MVLHAGGMVQINLGIYCSYVVSSETVAASSRLRVWLWETKMVVMMHIVMTKQAWSMKHHWCEPSAGA